MKFSYKFSNLLGTVYRRGDLLFTADGNSVISPVGNRITIYDLKNNKSNTLPVESRFNYTALDLSPNGVTLIAVNEVGEAHLISLISKTVIHRHQFKRPVLAIKFSPDGKYFAACKENSVFLFRAPGQFTGEYNALVMERVYHGAFDATTCMDWTTDSKVLAVGSKDMSTKLYSLKKWTSFKPYSLGSHTDAIVACFFEKNSLDITTVSRNGQVCVWACNVNLSDLTTVKSEPDVKKVRIDESDSEDDAPVNPIETKDQNQSEDKEQQVDFFTGDAAVEGRDEQGKVLKDKTAERHQFYYKRLARHYLADEVRKSNVHATLTAAVYQKETKILVTGFSNGCFFLHELPEVTMIHSLSVSDQSITSLSINSSGDWLALGCAGLGQLLVWEWQSEQYVMKQQGHSSNMSCLCYIPNTDFIVTGGLDGKVKLWNTTTGFCVVTFDEHSSAVTQVEYCPSKRFFVSASLDGTVRAFDIKRYSNFKTYVSPRPVQFSCVAVDTSGKLICAGGQDVFEIYLWENRGNLLEILSGHEGPVVSVAFCPLPESTSLVSASWDRTIRLWNALESSSANEPILLQSDALCVTYNPNGEQVAVSTLNGYITVFDVKTSNQLHSIEGREDLGSGRADDDLVTAKQSLRGKAFSTLCYSADGECILAGGQSKNVCIYNVAKGILLRKFEITQNRSLDAVDDFINRRKMSEFGNLSLVEEREAGEGGNVTVRLPGVKSGDMASRSFKPEIRVLSIQFSPDGHSWAACTTEGLLIYSLNTGIIFSPFLLEMDTTFDSVREALKNKEYALAVMKATQLSEKDLLIEVLEQVPVGDIKLTIVQLSKEYAVKVINFLSAILSETSHIQFYMIWLSGLLEHLGPLGKHGIAAPTLVALDRDLSRKYEQLRKICDFNKYTIGWIKELGQIKAAAQSENKMEIDENKFINIQSALSSEEEDSNSEEESASDTD